MLAVGSSLNSSGVIVRRDFPVLKFVVPKVPLMLIAVYPNAVEDAAPRVK
jgi:hypothetical protein